MNTSGRSNYTHTRSSPVSNKSCCSLRRYTSSSRYNNRDDRFATLVPLLVLLVLWFISPQSQSNYNHENENTTTTNNNNNNVNNIVVVVTAVEVKSKKNMMGTATTRKEKKSTMEQEQEKLWKKTTTPTTPPQQNRNANTMYNAKDRQTHRQRQRQRQQQSQDYHRQQEQKFNSYSSFQSSTTTNDSTTNSFHGRQYLQRFFKKGGKNLKPRHIVYGIVDGTLAAMKGTVVAAMIFFTVPLLGYYKSKSSSSSSSSSSSINGNGKLHGSLIGFMEGIVSGIVYGAMFAITGYWTAIQLVWDGIIATPNAINAYRLGQVWNDRSQRYEYYYLDTEATELSSQSKYGQEQQDQQQQQAHCNNDNKVADMTYYKCLQVSSCSSPKDIKQAYYRLARDVHPDKNRSVEAAEQFRKIHIAYVTLYDDEKRTKYDKFGPLNSNNSDGTSSSLQLHFDPHIFYAILFNSQLVEPYIGELTIAAFTYDILHVAYTATSTTSSAGTSATDEEMWKLLWNIIRSSGDNDDKARKRQVDIAMFLRTEVQPYVSGELTSHQFRMKCRMKAQKISNGSMFGYQFLETIGTTLLLESKQFLGYQQLLSIPGFISGGISTIQKTTKRIQRLFYSMRKALAIFRAIIESYQVNNSINTNKIYNTYSNGKKKPFSSPSDRFRMMNDPLFIQQQHDEKTKVLEKELRKLLPKLFNMAWAYNEQDISYTIHGACKKLFQDSGLNSRYKRMERADAIQIMGEEFLKEAKKKKKEKEMETATTTTTSTTTTTTTTSTTTSMDGMNNTSNTTADDNELMHRLEIAFHAAQKKEETEYDSETQFKKQTMRPSRRM